MNPTDQLMDIIHLNSRKGLPIVKTLRMCIERGAILNKAHYNEECIPLFCAIMGGCELDVVRILKDAWWNNSYYYETTSELVCCARDRGKVHIIRNYIDVFLNTLYRGADDERKQFIRECAELFGVVLCENDAVFKALVTTHSRKYNPKVDTELIEHFDV